MISQLVAGIMTKKEIIKYITITSLVSICILAVGIISKVYKRNQWKNIFYSCQYVRIHTHKDNKDIFITNRMEIMRLWATLNPEFINNDTNTFMPTGRIAWVGYPCGVKYERIPSNQNIGADCLLIINIYSNGVISQVTSPVKLAVTRMPEYCTEVLRLIRTHTKP